MKYALLMTIWCLAVCRQVDASPELQAIQELSDKIGEQLKSLERKIDKLRTMHRPVVVVKFERDKDLEKKGETAFNIVMRNIGLTPATDLQITIPKEWIDFWEKAMIPLDVWGKTRERKSSPAYQFGDEDALGWAYRVLTKDLHRVKNLNAGEKWQEVIWPAYTKTLKDFCEKGYIYMPVTCSYKSCDESYTTTSPIEGCDFVKGCLQNASQIYDATIGEWFCPSQANPPK